MAEEYRERPASEGGGAVRLGPYFKHQCWENGRNVSRRVSADEVDHLREDLQNAHRFDQIISKLASLALDEGRTRRAALRKAAQSQPAREQESKKTPASGAGGTLPRNRSLPVTNPGADQKRRRRESLRLVYVLLRFLAFVHDWHHSFTRLFTLLRSALWWRWDLPSLLHSYGTASGAFRFISTPQRPCFTGF